MLRRNGCRPPGARKPNWGRSLSHGCYAAVPIPDPKLGPRKVDIDTMYNTARYRPNYAQKMGLPIFLTKA